MSGFLDPRETRQKDTENSMVVFAAGRYLSVMGGHDLMANSQSEPRARTLGRVEGPEYPVQGFESIAAARQWVSRFVSWYNDEHRHSAIRYVTPSQRHKGEDIKILANRHRVYQKAKQRRQDRWSGSTRNWDPIKEVWLNCPKEVETCASVLSEAA